MFASLSHAARTQESALQTAALRAGLLSVIPAAALRLLSWRELELRVCGVADVDLAALRRHTVYRPAGFSEESPVVQRFWAALEAFSPEQRALFLQFAWARSRLPADMDDYAESTYRMQVNIVDLMPMQPPAGTPTASGGAPSSGSALDGASGGLPGGAVTLLADGTGAGASHHSLAGPGVVPPAPTAASTPSSGTDAEDGSRGAPPERMPLPTSETCFFCLTLPHYPTDEIMRSKLLLAITTCSAITS
jgi:hypothetical protein